MQTAPSFRGIVRCLVLLGSLLVAASAAPVSFNIPAQPAASALMAFSKQARTEVVFAADDLKDVRANAVVGSYESTDAIALLLQNTGFAARRNGGGKFVVAAAGSSGGTVRGSLVSFDGQPLEGVAVRAANLGVPVFTDRDGAYVIHGVRPGVHTLVATREGFQPMHITEVRVRAGAETVIGRQRLRAATADPITRMDPYVVEADNVMELDPYEVTTGRMRPFSDANLDIPRTMNDVQPYYIFDNRAIEMSGATTVEDFLTRNLTMNVLRSTNTSNTTSYGTNSDVNLRGLGVDRTLILVNGRRLPNTVVLTSNYQPDVNGISPAMIDRIEVLPTSASGIYGGNALGGVINIVLKKDYTGGELRASYANTFDSDTARRTIALNFGTALEGGRTSIQLGAQYSDANAIRLMDRADLIRANYARAIANNPDHVYSLTSGFAGATPNIMNTTTANLVLDNGTSLGSRVTHIPAGFAPTATRAQLEAALIANAGKLNLELPSIYWLQTGLGSYFGFAPTSRSFNASVTRKMMPNLEMFVDYSFKRNRGISDYSAFFSSTRRVAANAPNNPFNTDIFIRAPLEDLQPRIGTFDSQIWTIGLKANLPWNWVAHVDFTHVADEMTHTYAAPDNTVLNADFLSGALNPFHDTQLYPFSIAQYRTMNLIGHGSSQSSTLARASGPLFELPWGAPSLTLGLEHRITGTNDGYFETVAPLSPASNVHTTYLGFQQVISSAYAEVQLPLVKREHFPFVHSLDLQVAGRKERFRVATGTSTRNRNTITGAITYGAPNIGGQPFRGEDEYESTNPTVGFKYQPIADLSIRASYSTDFQPPLASQLQKNPEPSVNLTQITDPQKGTTYGVQTIGGGNPSVVPQNSTSWNAGVIYEPRAGRMRGLRLNAEYYEIDQDDAIASVGAQIVVNLYPERVTRDASGTITLVDTSAMNLYKRAMRGWDFNVGYQVQTERLGTFFFRGTQSLILENKTQFSLTAPVFDGVNYPLDTTTGGSLKRQSNVSLNWEAGPWTAGISSRFLSAYRAYGSAGGPLSLQSAGGANSGTYATAQGNNGWIPAQDIHDVLLGYRFGRQDRGDPSRVPSWRYAFFDGLSVTLGVKNVFDTAPEYDVGPFGLGFFSPFVDVRMREYWISVRRSF